MTSILLPFDIYVHILEQLPPPGTDQDEAALKTLIACLRTSSTLRDAASISGLWKPRYKHRYTVSNLDDELFRRHTTHEDWKLMYSQRRRLDQRALKILDDIVQTRNGRHERARELSNTLSYDVWNALEKESQCTLPEAFRETGDESGRAACNAAPRRFWAKAILGTIARSTAIKTWGQVLSSNDQPSLEIAFASLSAFFGVLPTEITSKLDALADQCRSFIIQRHITLDKDSFNSDAEVLKQISTAICDYMRTEGFKAVDGRNFYSLHSRLPHCFLTTHKATIPISLVFVFVCIARRLGIDASPVDFPTKVLAIVSSPDPTVPDIYVDVFGSDIQAILSATLDIPILLAGSGVPPNSTARYIQPASTDFILIRASRNILASSWMPHGINISDDDKIAAQYIGRAIGLLFLNERHYLVGVQNLFLEFPLDTSAVMMDSLSTCLTGGLRDELMASCTLAIEQEESASLVVNRRSTLPPGIEIRYFVGMVFQHQLLGYIGYIYGWEPYCMAGEDWIAQMNVDALERGRRQPFYHVISQNGSQRYVAEDNITPIGPPNWSSRRTFRDAPQAARYFEDVVSCPRGARFLLSPELQTMYPEDELFALRWMEEIQH
ncbi:YccV-like-domain-containing protein [Hygrophoropsis aurantiaca]|uniref:YccV-like-domain-containing protein n=1 Tax=Hygrophoropsis aurantiaca TaxID=72124 RepID=A0ACB8ASW0_9AGAM|nr:YccV-like-domain-containing protein [Hygrophoropsis aurantiaca]